jgi:hypothetical protein
MSKLPEANRKALSLIFDGDTQKRLDWERALGGIAAGTTDSAPVNHTRWLNVCSALADDDGEGVLAALATISKEDQAVADLFRLLANEVCRLGTKVDGSISITQNNDTSVSISLVAIQRQLEKLTKLYKSLEASLQVTAYTQNATLVRDAYIPVTRVRFYNQFMMTINGITPANWRNVNHNWKAHERNAFLLNPGPTLDNPVRGPAVISDEGGTTLWTFNQRTRDQNGSGALDLGARDYAAKPEPVGYYDLSNEVIPKRIFHRIQIANIVGMTAATFNGYGATWADMEISVFEAALATTVTILGDVADQVSELTPLTFDEDSGEEYNNFILDYEAVEAGYRRVEIFHTILMTSASVLLSSFGFDGVEDLFAAIPDLFGIESISEPTIDFNEMEENMASKAAAQPWSPIYMNQFEYHNDPSTYALSYLHVVSGTNNTKMPDYGLSQSLTNAPPNSGDFANNTVGINGNLQQQAVPGQNYVPYKAGTTNQNVEWLSERWGGPTPPNAWLKLEALTNITRPSIIQRAYTRVGVGRVKFSESVVKDKITSGLNGGKLEYSFDISVPYPEVAYIDSSGHTQRTSSWNALIIDGHVYALFDSGWNDKVILFSNG